MMLLREIELGNSIIELSIDEKGASRKWIDCVAVTALVRVLADAFLTGAYFLSLDNDAEWEMARDAAFLHDAQNRHRMFRRLEENAAKADFKAATSIVKSRLESNKAFSSLHTDRKDKILKGQEPIAHGRQGALRIIGEDVNHWNEAFAYFSAYVHSHPVSYLRYGAHGNNNEVLTPAQLALLQYALTFGAACLHAHIQLYARRVATD